MVKEISAEQAYATSVMNNLPQVEKGRVHTLQKGDNLWNLAKRELNKKNAKNSEISNYMLLIAKLNNLDTIEKMNGLKVSDKIFLPKTSAPEKTTTVAAVAKSKTNIAQAQTSAEISINKLKEIILNDKTLKIEKMYKGYSSTTSLYHVYNEHLYESGYKSSKHPLMSFVKDDKTEKITTISYNDQQKDQRSGQYDYDIDKKGNIVTHGYFRKAQAGKINETELTELHRILNEKSKNIKEVY